MIKINQINFAQRKCNFGCCCGLPAILLGFSAVMLHLQVLGKKRVDGGIL